MRKLGARSIAVALVAVLISGCSSSGGKKSFSWASMNPMTYFAKSDSDPVPKPSDQMAPTVTLGDASEVASTSGLGMAPPSPYRAAETTAGTSRDTNSLTAGNMTPQRGSYDPNSLPLSPSAGQYPGGSGYQSPSGGYADYQLPASGYQMPTTNSGYDANQSAQYRVGGNYDIQNQTQGSIPGPAYASPTAPYAQNTAPSSGYAPSSYQTPPLPSQGSGYDPTLAQDPYGNTPPPYPGAASNSPSGPWGSGAEESYANSSYAHPGDSHDAVASLPKMPPLPSEYTNNQPVYDAGNSGYYPTNAPSYTSPTTGGYVQPATATAPSYAPGSVSRYPSIPSQSSTPSGSGGYGTY